MNLAVAISIYGGGPGSGCNPDAGTCGRSAGERTYTVNDVEKLSSPDDQLLHHDWAQDGRKILSKPGLDLNTKQRIKNAMTLAGSVSSNLNGGVGMFGIYADRDTVLGFIKLYVDKANSELVVADLAVHPKIIAGEIKSKGIGTALMIHAAREAAKRGLSVGLVALRRAETFYEKLGMHESVKESGAYEWTPEEAKAFAQHG